MTGCTGARYHGSRDGPQRLWYESCEADKTGGPMSTGSEEEKEPLPGGEKPYQATYIELFFDLVFVYGLAQLSYVLATDLGWRGLGRTLVALLVLWWVWSYTVWMTDRLGVARPAIQVIVLATMIGSLLMAIAAPAAFGEQGYVFAIAYAVIQVGRVVVTLLACRERGERVNVRLLLAAVAVTLAPWIAGAFTTGLARGALWTLALALAYTLGRFDLPVMRVSRFGDAEWAISPEHLGVRHQHFAIIALGDTILASGVALRDYDFAGWRITALALAFAITVLLWRDYFYRAGEMLPATLEASPARIRVAVRASYAHLLMVTGIIVVAVGDVLVIDKPLEPASWATVGAILYGPALFLLGRAVLDYLTFSRVALSRMVGLVVIAAAYLPAVGRRQILVAALSAVVLLGVALSDIIGWRRHPRAVRPPDS